MLETLDGLEAGGIQPVPQDDAAASLAPILQREDALVDFARSAGEIYNRWRGFQPWPGAYTFFRGKKLTLHRLVPAGRLTAVSPGELVVERDRLFVAAGSGTRLELLEVQLEGKKRMPVADFLRGAAPHPHEKLAPQKYERLDRPCPVRPPLSCCSNSGGSRSRTVTHCFAPKLEALSAIDKNLMTTLVMGVLRWQLVLQQRIRQALTKSKGHLADPVQVALELGALQLLLLDRIPAHAAIFESVELARQSGNPYAVGLVNAVLRKLAQAPKA